METRIADNVSHAIGDLRWLAELIREHAEPLLAGDQFVPSFTDHSAQHSWRLLNNVSMLVKDRLVLDPAEALVLFGAAFLHDIALARPDQVLSKELREHGWYEGELRHNHGSYSSRYVRDMLLPELCEMLEPDASRVRQNQDLFEGIARICEFHTARQYEQNEPSGPSRRLTRFPLLGVLFVLADALDVGDQRVDIAKVIDSGIDLDGKKYWLAHACIQRAAIRGDTVILMARNFQVYGKAQFIESILRPFVEELERYLKWAHLVLSRYEVRPYKSKLKVSIVGEGGFSQATTLLHDSNAFQRQHSRRQANWDKRRDALIVEPGVINQERVDNEFLVLRRWGSSTHRLFASVVLHK
jgi:hypothetical protein